MAKHVVTAAVQAAIIDGLGATGGYTPAMQKVAATKYRTTGDVAAAVAHAVATATGPKGKAPKATQAKATTTKVDATPKATKAQAKGKATPKADQAAATPKRATIEPPKGWAPTKGDAIGSFVRYARKLRNGAFATEYDAAAAATPADTKLAKAHKAQGHDGRYVCVVVPVVGDTLGTPLVRSFATHAAAYAWSMAQQGDIAPSIVASLGKLGAAAIA